jgi:PII-like signaling protein
MNIKGKCNILKIYISEDSMYKGHSLYHALVMRLKELGLAGVTVTRGIEGYGQQRRLSTARILELSSSLPVIVEAVDLPERIENALPAVKEMVNEGLVIVTEVDVIKYGKE